MSANEFTSKREELTYLMDLNKSRAVPLELWCVMMEQHFLSEKKLLREATNPNNLRIIKSAENDFGSSGIIGEKYIPVPIFLLGDVIKVFDYSGENPPKKSPEFLPLTSKTSNSIIIGGITWPNKLLSPLSYQTIILIDSPENYGKLSTYLTLSIDINLLPLTKMKVTLVAGDTQSPGGRRNWASLANIPGGNVFGYLVVKDFDLDTSNYSPGHTKTASNLIDTIMNLGGEYS